MRHLLLPFLVAALGACAMSPYAEGPTLGENPALLPLEDEEIRYGQFYLGPEDEIRLDFHRHQDLNRTYKVRADGTLWMHLVGEVPIAGMPLREAQDTIREAYGKYLRDPSLLVEVTSWSGKRKVTVLGHVSRPSVIALTDPQTDVLQVIGLAGGVATSGDRTGILIGRKVDGVWTVRPYDMELMFAPPEAGIRVEVPYVQPGDVIYVLRTWQDEFDAIMKSVNDALRAGVFLERIITGADAVVAVV